tara:strand:+ start:612 stop:962 length:351 start_codon:yes stop_codon:yes gene_type:complete
MFFAIFFYNICCLILLLLFYFRLTGLLKVMLEQKESIGKLASEKDKLIKKIKDQNVSRYKKLIDTLQKSMDGIKGSNDSGMIKENDSRFNNVKSSLENCGSEMNNIPYNTMVCIFF